MENNVMSWSKQTQKLWQAFENAVLSRDEKQFEIYHAFAKSKELDEKKQVVEEELVN